MAVINRIDAQRAWLYIVLLCMEQKWCDIYANYFILCNFYGVLFYSCQALKKFFFPASTLTGGKLRVIEKVKLFRWEVRLSFSCPFQTRNTGKRKRLSCYNLLIKKIFVVQYVHEVLSYIKSPYENGQTSCINSMFEFHTFRSFNIV